MEQAQPSQEIRHYALWAVAPAQVPNLWTLVESDVARVCKRPGMRCSPLHFRQDLIEERAQMFLVLEPVAPEEAPHYRGCVVTRLLFCRNGERVLEVALAVGDQVTASVPGLLSELENFALAEGCCAMEFVGRPGWSKILPDDYRETGRIFTKELDHGSRR